MSDLDKAVETQIRNIQTRTRAARSATREELRNRRKLIASIPDRVFEGELR